jgi:hypothetical protein
VGDRSVHAAKRHAVDEEFDLLVEHLAPDVEIAVVERPVIAGRQRPEIHTHGLLSHPHRAAQLRRRCVRTTVREL